METLPLPIVCAFRKEHPIIWSLVTCLESIFFF
jgi:hypothetical protein